MAMIIIVLLVCIGLLVCLISWAKWTPFLAFLVVSIAAGLSMGIPVEKIMGSIRTGVGSVMGDLVIIICLGAMLGKLVAESGAAQRIATTTVKLFGIKHIAWAMMVTGFVTGIALFYNVGFVLLVPLVFSVSYSTSLSPVFTALPMLAALSVTHGFLPPHPAPSAIAIQLHASTGKVLLYGLLVAVPAVLVAGPLFAQTARKIRPHTPLLFSRPQMEASSLPGIANSFISALLPAILLIISTALSPLIAQHLPTAKSFVDFASEPAVVMLISVIIVTFTLGSSRGMKTATVMNLYGDAVKDIASILLIVAGAGAFKQVLTDSGVSTVLGNHLQHLPVHPLVQGWLIAAVIRVCVGSATVAGLTAAGIIAPLIMQSHVNAELMVLSVGAGSLMFSHVNDSGFWMYKEYFSLSIRDTLRAWSLMETIVSVVGLIGVLVLSHFVG